MGQIQWSSKSGCNGVPSGCWCFPVSVTFLKDTAASITICAVDHIPIVPRIYNVFLYRHTHTLQYMNIWYNWYNCTYIDIYIHTERTVVGNSSHLSSSFEDNKQITNKSLVGTRMIYIYRHIIFNELCPYTHVYL